MLWLIYMWFNATAATECIWSNSVMQRPRQHLCKHVLSLFSCVCFTYPILYTGCRLIVVCLMIVVNVSMTTFSCYLTLRSGPFLPANVRRLYSTVYHFTCHFRSCHFYCHDDVIKWKHFPPYWPFLREFTGQQWIPRTKTSDAELWCFPWSAPE